MRAAERRCSSRRNTDWASPVLLPGRSLLLLETTLGLRRGRTGGPRRRGDLLADYQTTRGRLQRLSAVLRGSEVSFGRTGRPRARLARRAPTDLTGPLPTFSGILLHGVRVSDPITDRPRALSPCVAGEPRERYGDLRMYWGLFLDSLMSKVKNVV
jgi:hypothetical protein